MFINLIIKLLASLKNKITYLYEYVRTCVVYPHLQFLSQFKYCCIKKFNQILWDIYLMRNKFLFFHNILVIFFIYIYIF